MLMKIMTRIIHVILKWIFFKKMFFILMTGAKIMMIEAIMMNVMIMALLMLPKNGSDK